jgi:NAD(P)-dependent dehydrogenase (short-subunit alcohol dehydrogenase family)
MGKLEGTIALVTAGTSGIGLATAKLFVNAGAYVFITGLRDSELVAAVKAVGRSVCGVRADVSDLAELNRLVEHIKRERGRLDIVFASASIAKQPPCRRMTEELYESLFNINVQGLLATVQTALPLMPEGASLILNAFVVSSQELPLMSLSTEI